MKIRANKDTATVYSTDHGSICPDCGKPITNCVCSQKQPVKKGDGIIRVALESKGRKGKGVTLITGVSLDHDGILNLAKMLKQKCGSGGTVKNGVIEIQGDHRDVLMEELKKQGYTVKRAGG